ncbi:MAG: GH36-type glycosyl hydrolase domain-containing protein [Acholeplasmatales bacterium]
MIIKNGLKTYQIGDKLKIDILLSGDIYKIHFEEQMINQLKGNLIDGMVSNIYLRNFNTKERVPLLGLKGSNVKTTLLDNQILYEGSVLGVSYEVLLSVKDFTYIYQVSLEGNGDYELYFTQDIGLNHEGAILNNEAYNAQYIDHRIFETKDGYITLSRQNQGKNDLLQIGSNCSISSYSTDMLQFYGLSFKESREIVGLKEAELENKNLQYEMPLIALKTKPFTLGKKVISFYGLYVPNHEEILKEPLKVEIDYVNKNKKIKELKFIKPLIGEVLNGLSVRHPSRNRSFVEYNEDKKVIAFFDENKHIVKKEKELLTERTHGHLMISGDILNAGITMASTNFMNGIFASRIVIGNTNFHRLNGDLRNQLNLQTISGLRAYLKLNNKWHLLNVPSYYEMTASKTSWVYVIDNDEIKIDYQVALNKCAQRLTFKSKNNLTYDVIFTNQLILGDNEYKNEINLNIKDEEVIVKFYNNRLVNDNYPNLKYKISSKDVKYTNDSIFFKEEKGHGLLIMEYKAKSEIIIDILGTIDEFETNKIDYKEEFNKYENFIKTLINLEVKSDLEIASKFNKTLYWYTHNALVHYSSPHGLEQTGGAAWGTRDILQGPFELFLAYKRYDIARNILLKVYSRQFLETYDWPQWFMFDKYYYIQAHDSHGDIIVWPLKALADYLTITSDYSILKEEVTYFSIMENRFIKGDTVISHVKNQITAIINSSIKNTSLPKYGGGDWNDTLQPKDSFLTEKMVSSWTISLIYEALHSFSKNIRKSDVKLYNLVNDFSIKLKEDYYKYIMIDSKPAGFIVFDNEKPTPLLHPNDRKTGIKYRLLSYQQPIISELISKEEALNNHTLMLKHLKFPDGMRLMDKPVTYKGGLKTYFQRAETASNFGREVGILYVHAHIRHIEALAKLGFHKEMKEELEEINPIGINSVVKISNIRQSNVYFSSSDANFYDRYLAKEQFHLLKEEKIKVKSGWRLYSSGPGIYINQLISNYLGIKQIDNKLYLDPVHKLDKLEVKCIYKNKEIIVKYFMNDNKDYLLINNSKIDILREKEYYRKGGYLINNDLLKDKNIIEIHYKK